MSTSRAAQATRALLKVYSNEALDGSLTVGQVVDMVRESVPGAHKETILKAIEDYGPIGEGDQAWERRAQQPQIPSWFYNPKTGDALS